MKKYFGCCFAALLVAGCGGSGSSRLPQNPAKVAPPGHFGISWISDYSHANNISSCADDIPPLIDAGPNYKNVDPSQSAAEDFAAQLTAPANGKSAWTETFEHSQTAVSAGDFGLGTSNGDDAVYFAGHGDIGIASMPYCGSGGSLNSQYFGPGAVTPNSTVNLGSSRNIGIVSAKWLFFDSSDSVTPPANLVPSDSSQYDGDWRPAFRSSANHPAYLHGIYGAWQGPGTCTDGGANTLPGRACDITTFYGYVAAAKLGTYLWSSAQPVVVHNAWNDAMVDAGFTVGPSEVEDNANIADTFTGGSGINATPAGGSYQFTWLGSNLIGSPKAVQITPQTFTLQPMSMTTEAFNQANDISRAQSYLGETVTSSADSTKSMYTTVSGLYASQTANSGAVVMNARSQNNPMTFSLSQAQSYAQTYISDTLGMPSDAVLFTSSVVNEYDFDSGTAKTVAYVINYIHKNGNVIGGDAIHVTVDDNLTYTNGTCLQYDVTSPDPPQKPVKYCAEYQQIAHDNLNVSHMYRLWRTMASVRVEESGNQSTGGQSIDAVTASQALPNASDVTAYEPGYWTPSAEADTNQGAEPAWLFRIGNDSIIAVDAFDGKILGSATY